MSETHKEGLAILRYGVVARKGFLVLTGGVGTGKTTLLRALLHSLAGNIRCCLLNNPAMSRDEFFTYLARAYELPWNGSKADFVIAFAEMLERCGAKRQRVLLIIDEAHVMPVDLLEEIRLLSNQDPTGGAVLSVFLVGQPELNEHLKDERLLPLRQRMGIRFHLEPFSRETTAQYILFRLRIAGARNLNIVSEEALSLIHQVCHGTPRLINIVCAHALLSGFAEEKTTIDAGLVRECVADFHFPGEESSLPVSPAARRLSPVAVVRWTVVVAGLLLLILVVIDGLPQTRAYSPLARILPDQWLVWRHLFPFSGR